CAPATPVIAPKSTAKAIAVAAIRRCRSVELMLSRLSVSLTRTDVHHMRAVRRASAGHEPAPAGPLEAKRPLRGAERSDRRAAPADPDVRTGDLAADRRDVLGRTRRALAQGRRAG